MAKRRKKRVGRPQLPKGEQRSEYFTIRLTEHELESLRTHCWRYDISTGHCIREALKILSILPDWEHE